MIILYQNRVYKLFLLFFIFIFSVLKGFGQEMAGHGMAASRAGVFISPIAEVNGYAKEAAGFGFGLAFGAGDRLVIGIKPLFAFSLSSNDDSFSTLEITFFMRYFIFDSSGDAGLFAQLELGGAAYFTEDKSSLPAEFGSLSAGLCAGWRFPLRGGWYAEPYVRFGYPYGFGAGVYAGYKF